jgi:hypothetical protein
MHTLIADNNHVIIMLAVQNLMCNVEKKRSTLYIYYYGSECRLLDDHVDA